MLFSQCYSMDPYSSKAGFSWTEICSKLGAGCLDRATILFALWGVSAIVDSSNIKIVE